MRTQGEIRLALRRGGGNSLAAHIASAVDGRIQGKSLVTNGPIFSAQDHVTPAYTRNVNFWGPAPLGVSPWNSDNGVINAGTLITPRHVIYTNHGLVGVGFPANGSTLRFIAADNSIITRTQSQFLRIGTTDIVIALLDSNLPGTIPHFTVMPDDLGLYLPSSFRVPILMIDQEEKGLVSDLYSFIPGGIYFRQPDDSFRRSFWELPIAGDSGDPLLGLINAAWTVFGLITNQEGLSPGLSGMNAALNQAIIDVDALGGVATGFTVSNPTLTGFTKI